MKICFNLQSQNENKSPLLNGNYPFIVYEVADYFECPQDFLEMTVDNFTTYKNSFDITAYLASIQPPIAPVTARQIRLALFQYGIIESMIDASISTMDEPQRSTTMIGWKYAASFDRVNQFVDLIGSDMGMTPQQIDQLWELAKTL
jgi:hypothetical protein